MSLKMGLNGFLQIDDNAEKTNSRLFENLGCKKYEEIYNNGLLSMILNVFITKLINI